MEADFDLIFRLDNNQNVIGCIARSERFGEFLQENGVPNELNKETEISRAKFNKIKSNMTKRNFVGTFAKIE